MESSIRTIDASNVNRYGFFCYKSKPKTAGYQQKREWLGKFMDEGVELKILYEGERSAGFVEYAPGESTWRVINAPGYLVIHCMWVVGSGKNKGYGSYLLEQVESEAKSQGLYGVAVLVSQSTWLAKKDFFLKHGFKMIDQAPPSFELLVKQFDHSAPASFPQDWDARLMRIPEGLVVYHSGQCPYHAMFVTSLLNAASRMGIPTHLVELKNCHEARQLSPSAYGVFSVVYNGKLLSYHPIGGKTLLQMLEISNE